jgi:hypothetical protein
MNRRIYISALLLSCYILGLFSGCTSTAATGAAENTQKKEVEKHEYLTGVIYTEKEGTKEIDCGQKLLGCRESEVDGENVLLCMGGDPLGEVTISGGVTDYTLEKELC